MAQLIQCDFCGNITNQIAARVIIEPVSVNRHDMLNILRDDDYETIVDRLTRDCCKDCVSKFVETKAVPLAIRPSGEPVTTEDL